MMEVSSSLLLIASMSVLEPLTRVAKIDSERADSPASVANAAQALHYFVLLATRPLGTLAL